MSTQVNQYVVYGYFLGFKEAKELLIKNLFNDLDEDEAQESLEKFSDKYHDSAFKNTAIEVNGFSFIEDGMNGEYSVFGKVFQKTKAHEFLETGEIPKVSSKIKAQLKEEFERLFGKDLEYKPKMMILTHYR